MKVPVIVLVCLSFVSAKPPTSRDAAECKADSCSISNNCQCSGTKSPLADGEEAPMLISLTFDESVVDNLYTEVWEPLLFDRKNPDGNKISATFFVPHEYTDYRRVQDLWLQGFEIGVNSITKNSLAEYWSNATVETLQQEFEGQRTIISRFANIPIEEIVGARTPQLQIEGDVSINAYVASGIEYDSSWTSRSTSMFFPYTLDYLSTQECRTGTTCPTESHQGFWIAPIINLQGNSTSTVLECNSLITCNVQGSADEISSWLITQIERERSTSKAPLTLMVSSSWFRFTDNSYEGFQTFLDTLATYTDTYLVSQKQVIEWAKNPVTLSQYKTETPDRTADCDSISCPLKNANNDLRYMMSCVPCPEVYPWLGNPLGESNPTDAPPTESPPTSPPTTPPPTTTPAPPTENPVSVLTGIRVYRFRRSATAYLPVWILKDIL